MNFKHLNQEHQDVLKFLQKVIMAQNRRLLEFSNSSNFNVIQENSPENLLSLHELAYLISVLSNLQERALPSKFKHNIFDSVIDETIYSVKDSIHRRNLLDILYMVRLLPVFKEVSWVNLTGNNVQLLEDTNKLNEFWDMLYMYVNLTRQPT